MPTSKWEHGITYQSFANSAFIRRAIEDIGGLEYESEYPYVAKKKQCHFNRTLSHVQVAGFVDLPKGNETAMQEWLLSNGPISIGAYYVAFYRTIDSIY